MMSIIRIYGRSAILAASLAALAGCSDMAPMGNPTGMTTTPASSGSDGPSSTELPVVHMTGNAASGQQVFRFETFGNERFWTDALRLQQGMMAAGVTPLRALQLGLSVDIDALPEALRAVLAAELRTDLSPARAPTLNNPATLVAMINANAVIGLAAKDSNGDGVINIAAGDKTGASCAMCHTATDGSTYTMANGGSVGKRLDGRANHNLNFGTLVSLGLNSRAYYPVLQLALRANGGKTLGRAPTGLTPTSTEAEVDAYLSNPNYYPVGMFDDTVDGNGDPMHNSALFRTDLAAPWGTEGGLQAAPSALAGMEDAPLGNRVDNTKLLDMNAYLNSLQAPPGLAADSAVLTRARAVFRTNCTSCHNVDQGKAVPAFIVAMNRIFPGDMPVTLLAMRDPPLNPILDTMSSIFDDKMAVVNASMRGGIRGTALPLLLDLARKPNYLHDNSVSDLDSLLNPSRGATAPHPFYLSDAGQRSDMVAYLRSLDTNSR